MIPKVEVSPRDIFLSIYTLRRIWNKKLASND